MDRERGKNALAQILEIYRTDMVPDVKETHALMVLAVFWDDAAQQQLGKKRGSAGRSNNADVFYTPELRPAMVEYLSDPEHSEVLSTELGKWLQDTRPRGTVNDPETTLRRMHRTISKDSPTFKKRSSGQNPDEYWVSLRITPKSKKPLLTVIPTESSA